MANRLVINETIAAYANAAIDGANATGGRDAVVEVRNQMRQIAWVHSKPTSIYVSRWITRLTTDARRLQATFSMATTQWLNWSYVGFRCDAALFLNCFSV